MAETVKVQRLEFEDQGIYQGFWDRFGDDAVKILWIDENGVDRSDDHEWGDKHQPPPFKDGMGGRPLSPFEKMIGVVMAPEEIPYLDKWFGWTSVDQRDNWFHPQKLHELLEMGAELFEYEVPEDALLVGGHQVAFDPERVIAKRKINP